MVELVHGTIKVDHLLNLEFEHGVQDCYTMLQRVFKDNLDITLSDYARPDDWWIQEGFDLYRDNFKHEGFITLNFNDNLSDLQPFDVMLIAIPDPRKPSVMVINHCAVYLGNGEVIHHRLGLRSERKRYSGALRNLTCMVIRHKDVTNFANIQVTKVDIMDYILPHKRDMLMGVINDKPAE